jgi:hypothetical protein
MPRVAAVAAAVGRPLITPEMNGVWEPVTVAR